MMVPQADVLEDIHQENLSGVPARGQWQVGFEALGSLLDPPWKGQLGSVSQETSLVLGPEKWTFSALPVTKGAFLDNFGGQLISASLASNGPESLVWAIFRRTSATHIM